MVNTQILAFIVKARTLYHLNDEAIRSQLLSNGWKESDINEALGIKLTPPSSSTPAVQSAVPVSAPSISPAPATTQTPLTTPPVTAPITDSPFLMPQANIMPSAPLQPSTTKILQPLTPNTPLQQAITPSISRLAQIDAAAPQISNKGLWWAVTIITLIVLAGGAAAYAYLNDIGPFNQPPYSVDNVISEGLTKVSSINTARYTYSISLKGSPREASTTPFIYDRQKINSDVEALRPMYERDRDRITLLSTLLTGIQYYQTKKTNKNKEYPPTLDDAVKSIPQNSYNSENLFKYKDLYKDFTYTATPNKTGYSMSIQFETLAAAESIKNYSSAILPENRTSTSTSEKIIVENTKVTIDERTPYVSAYRFTAIPPKPALIQLLESRDAVLSYVPSDIDFKLNASGVLRKQAASAKQAREAEMSIGADAKLGDSSYSIGLDFKLINEAIFLRVTKFPSLTGFFDVAKVKEKWIKITKEDQKDGLGSFFDGGANSTSLEKTDDVAQKSLEIYEKLIDIMIEEKTIVAKGQPEIEKINGINAYKYQFSINKASVLPTYKRYVKEIVPLISGTSTNIMIANKESEKETLAILESPMFSDLFDHLAKNTSFSVWFDKQGYPIRATQQIRIIPLEETMALKDQQFFFEASYDLREINTDISITEPSPTINMDQATELVLGQSLAAGKIKGKQATSKALISNLRAEAELYYDKNKNSYGREYGKSSCFNTVLDEKSFFTASSTAKTFVELKTNAGDKSESRCAGNATSYAISFELPSDEGSSPSRTFFCVDNTGVAKEIKTTKPDDTIIKTSKGSYACK